MQRPAGEFRSPRKRSREANMQYHPPCWRVASLGTIVLAMFASSALAQPAKPGSLKALFLLPAIISQNPVFQDQGTAFAALVTLETSTTPYGTSTGGFTFRYDPRLRAFVRSSDSFGPLFVQ